MFDPFKLSEELISISASIKASEQSENDLFTAYKKGETEFKHFVNDRMISNRVTDLNTFTTMKLHTFSTETVKKTLKVSDKDITVKADRTFFCKLVAIAQTRELDLYDVYSYELGPISWAIATPHGTIYKTTKSGLFQELEKDLPYICQAPMGSVCIKDAFANIQKLHKPGIEIRVDEEPTG